MAVFMYREANYYAWKGVEDILPVHGRSITSEEKKGKFVFWGETPTLVLMLFLVYF
jgi:hypothetical protein